MALCDLFLCGDVMTGRGIDQILETPSGPQLYEDYVRDARGYVDLAERASGPVPRRVDAAYVWGDALAELARVAPAARIVNLETAVTRSDEPWPGKGINYRMHPANVGCLSALGVDVCVLANNHVLDWARAGLLETLDCLHAAGMATAGAGRDLSEAEAPAVVPLPDGGRVLVLAVGDTSSGIPPSWAAGRDIPGVALLRGFNRRDADALLERAAQVRRPGDIVVASIHWGTNWGYDIPDTHVRFAHALVDGGVDVVHGHSSHHPRAIELHAGKPILYGCGDFVNDYEGIEGYEGFVSDLGPMYFASFDRSPGRARLVGLRIVPMRRQKLRLERARSSDTERLAAACRGFGTELTPLDDGSVLVRPGAHGALADERPGARSG